MSAIARVRKAGFTVAAVVLAAVLSAVLGASAVGSSQSAAARAWVEGWAAAMTANGKSFTDQTIRMVVHNTVPGSAVRVRLSNLTGARPLRTLSADCRWQPESIFQPKDFLTTRDASHQVFEGRHIGEMLR